MIFLSLLCIILLFSLQANAYDRRMKRINIHILNGDIKDLTILFNTPIVSINSHINNL